MAMAERKILGVSILINNTILFDTFSNYQILHKKLLNAKIDIAKIKIIVVSHNHYDHIGGLSGFVKNYNNLNIYLPSEASKNLKDFVSQSRSEVFYTKYDDFVEIQTNIFLTPEISKSCNSVKERSLVIKTSKGLVIIVGCSHAGIINIINSVENYFKTPIYAIVGGLHLKNLQTNDIIKINNILQR